MNKAFSGRSPSDYPFTTSFPFFNTTVHPLKPTALWGSLGMPYPTDIQWTNSYLAPGNLPMAPLPYVISATDGGLMVSYPQLYCLFFYYSFDYKGIVNLKIVFGNLPMIFKYLP